MSTSDDLLSFKQVDDEQQYNCAHKGGNDHSHNPGANVNAQGAEDPVAHKCAGNANQDITNQSKSVLDNLISKKTCHCANQN